MGLVCLTRRTRHRALAATACVLVGCVAAPAWANDPTSPSDSPRVRSKRVTVRISGPSTVTDGVPVNYVITLKAHRVLHHALLVCFLPVGDSRLRFRFRVLRPGRTYTRTCATTFPPLSPGAEGHYAGVSLQSGGRTLYYDRFRVKSSATPG